ncbi:hypothetical protein GCM10018966_094870 [Streptomyces yanii]
MAQAVEVRVAEWGRAGNVLVQDQTERVELVLPPLAVRLHDLTALPWQMSRASLCRDFWTVSCQLIRGR